MAFAPSGVLSVMACSRQLTIMVRTIAALPRESVVLNWDSYYYRDASVSCDSSP
jgi:hypothetical protein